MKETQLPYVCQQLFFMIYQTTLGFGISWGIELSSYFDFVIPMSLPEVIEALREDVL